MSARTAKKFMDGTMIGRNTIKVSLTHSVCSILLWGVYRVDLIALSGCFSIAKLHLKPVFEFNCGVYTLQELGLL